MGRALLIDTIVLPSQPTVYEGLVVDGGIGTHGLKPFSMINDYFLMLLVCAILILVVVMFVTIACLTPCTY